MQKILIIRLGALGDVLFSVPLAAALKDAGAEIGWLVGPAAIDVIKNNPCVDHCHVANIKEFRRNCFSIRTFRDLFRVVVEIRKQKYDIVLNCALNFNNAFMFIIFFLAAKRRVTFSDASWAAKLACNEFVEPAAHIRDCKYHVVERNLDFARYLEAAPQAISFVLPDVPALVKRRVDEMLDGLNPSLPIVAISPATSWVNKHWADRNWAELIRMLDKKCSLIMVGNRGSAGLASWIMSLAGDDINCLNMAGQTGLLELEEIYCRAKLVISPDSGGAHLAWATGKPAVITIFTCTPPDKFGPFGDEKKYFSVSGNLPCQPCYNRICPLASNKSACQNLPSARAVADLAMRIIDDSAVLAQRD